MICRADLLRFLWKSQHSVLVFPANVLVENRTKCKKNKKQNPLKQLLDLNQELITSLMAFSYPAPEQMEQKTSSAHSILQRKKRTNVLQMSRMCKALPLFMCHMFVHSGNGFPIAELRPPETNRRSQDGRQLPKWPDVQCKSVNLDSS